MYSNLGPSSVFDIIGCPRFTFTWPGLVLSSCSTSAQPFLPIFCSDSTGVTATSNNHKETLYLQSILRPAQDRPADEDWVNWLISESARAQFGASVTVQPLHFTDPCSATVFLQPVVDEDRLKAGALHVLLLSPIRRIEPLSSRLPAPARRLSGDTLQALSADEAYSMLDHVNRPVHGPNCDNWDPSNEQLRSLLQGLPEIAFIGSTDGKVLWFSDRWYEYVSGPLESMDPGWSPGHRCSPAEFGVGLCICTLN